MSAAGRIWVARELRRRWRSLTALTLLTALAGGAAITAAVGAHRSTRVVEETMEEHRQPDVMHLVDLPGFDWSPIVELPYVESHGLLAATGMCLEETGGLDDPALCTLPPVAGGWYDSIWRIDVLEGRMPTGPEEIAINRLAIDRYGWRVGQRLHVQGVRPGRLDDYWSGKPSGPRGWGPTFEVTVTGVFRGEDAWRVIGGGTGQPGFIMSNAFVPAHGKSIEYRVQAFLRLRGGEADIRRLRTDVARITGDPAFPIRNVREAQRRVERSTRIEASALVLFAAAVLAAAAVLLGQALVRLTAAAAVDARTLRSLGMSPRMIVLTLAAPGIVVAGVGAAGAAAIAVAASARMPIGLARSFDLHAGTKLDLPVLVPGVVGIAAAVALASIGAAVGAVRRARRSHGLASGRGAWSIARIPLPPPMALGVRMALERRPGGESIPVRPALLGTVVGVLAVVAAFTVREGIDETLSDPGRAGKAWDLPYLTDLDRASIATDPGVARAVHVTRAHVAVDGFPAPAYGTRAVGTPLEFPVLDGRAPRRPDEVALGPATLEATGARIGGTLRAGPDGGRRMRVVGTALLVEEGGHAAYDEGVWMTTEGLERLAPQQADWEMYLIDVRAGAAIDDVRRRLTAAGGTIDSARLEAPPAALAGLTRTRRVPALLGAVLALLGVGAVAHTLLTTVRRRRRDLAVLRALGLSARETRAVVAWSGTSIAAVGLVLGIPLGILAGHLAWRWISASMPLVHVAPGLVLATAVVIPAALLLVIAVAVAPARSAARLRPAAELRAE